LSAIRCAPCDHSVAHPPFHPGDEPDVLGVKLGKQGKIHVPRSITMIDPAGV